LGGGAGWGCDVGGGQHVDVSAWGQACAAQPGARCSLWRLPNPQIQKDMLFRVQGLPLPHSLLKQEEHLQGLPRTVEEHVAEGRAVALGVGGRSGHHAHVVMQASRQDDVTATMCEGRGGGQGMRVMQQYAGTQPTAHWIMDQGRHHTAPHPHSQPAPEVLLDVLLALWRSSTGL